MKFKSERDTFFGIIIFGIIAFLLGISAFTFLSGKLEKEIDWSFLLILAVVVLLSWLYFGTRYELTKEEGLTYRSGPFHGKIDIDRITEIVQGKTLWVGFKPATARNGLIIKYDKFQEIYISPKTNESFIKKAVELNGKIKITNPK